MSKRNTNPVCPCCNKKNQKVSPARDDSDISVFMCWTENCQLMGVEALPHHWQYFACQAAIIEAQAEVIEAEHNLTSFYASVVVGLSKAIDNAGLEWNTSKEEYGKQEQLHAKADAARQSLAELKGEM